MNGVHDMGGMQDFGPIAPEANEPWFHDRWERRAFALTLAMGATGAWNLDQARSARESLPPAQYLASSYYEIWFAGLVALMRERDLVSAAEIASGQNALPKHSAPPRRRAARSPRGRRNDVASARASGRRDARAHQSRGLRDFPPRPQQPGNVVAVHGAMSIPTSARRRGSQWLYTAFAARDRWGPDTSATAVHVDCFEPYLEAR